MKIEGSSITNMVDKFNQAQKTDYYHHGKSISLNIQQPLEVGILDESSPKESVITKEIRDKLGSATLRHLQLIKSSNLNSRRTPHLSDSENCSRSNSANYGCSKDRRADE